MKKILVYTFLIFTSIMFSSKAHGAQISGVTFKDMYQDSTVALPLQGMGLKTLLFFKAFVAGYYTNSKSTPDDLGEFPKRIEVQYFVNIPGSKLTSYTIERMKLNVTPTEFAILKPQVDVMGKYFADLKSGDRFALTYIPSIGTSFEHNGTVTGAIEGSAFGKALFSVWIGDKPFDEALKQAIMGTGKTYAVKTATDDITPGYVSRVVVFGPKDTTMQGSIKYSVVGRYVAHFKDFKGSVAVDDESNSIKSVILEIEAGSIESACAWCDQIVRSTRLLNTNKYPKIVFKSNDILQDQHGSSVKGIVEMNGRSKEMRFPFKFDIEKDAAGQRILKMHGQWNINRRDFDIIWNKLLDHGGILVGDIITVEWGIQARIQ